MKYKEYSGYTKTYVLVYNTGTGVMEDQYIEHNVVYETDSLEDAKKKSSELLLQNNTKAEVKSTWCNNTYHINVNILSEAGKKLKKQFSDKFDKLFKKTSDNKEYREIKMGNKVFRIKPLKLC